MAKNHKVNVSAMTFTIALIDSKVHVKRDKCTHFYNRCTALTAQVMCGCSAVCYHTVTIQNVCFIGTDQALR